MNTKNLLFSAVAIALTGFIVSNIESSYAQNNKRINNIILVHGAFADGSGWQPVYEMLTKKDTG